MKSKITVAILLIAIICCVAGLSVSLVKLNNSKKYINELESQISNEEKEEEVNQDTENKVDENNTTVTKEKADFHIDNDKNNIAGLPDGKSVKWYRQFLAVTGVEITITDNDIYFFVRPQEGGLPGNSYGAGECTAFDGAHVKCEGDASIVNAGIYELSGGLASYTLLFVLSDGTVKYIPIKNIVQQNFTIMDINGLNDVVQLRGVAVQDDTGTPIGDSVVVIKRDGTQELINNYLN